MSQPRILIVTPEITYLPKNMGNIANYLQAKGGGLADVSATLVRALFDQGVDVHVALPHYRRMFNVDFGHLLEEELRVYKSKIPSDRIHLAEDRSFYYRNEIYDDNEKESIHIALVFQREVINNIIPRVQPTLIHCNDWMTGLIPAMARRMNIPCLFTVHNVHTFKCTLETIENCGIDAAEFWNYLYYENPPNSYETTRNSNPVDLLASGTFASHFINTVSPAFLQEIIDGKHEILSDSVRREFSFKAGSGYASGILNAPDPGYNPENDKHLTIHYDATTFEEGKQKNKAELQQQLGLDIDPQAPIFFWPSRLDPVQKGCGLLTHILYDLISDYGKENLQLIIVANGSFQPYFHQIVQMHQLQTRVAVRNYDDPLSRKGYAASDFILMPSSFEPCGLPQMIGQIYGALPIVHDTGGLHDTVSQLDIEKNTGSGFVFDTFGSDGLRWAIDKAMDFYRLPATQKKPHISRIMAHAKESFNYTVTAKRYVGLYHYILTLPFRKHM